MEKRNGIWRLFFFEILKTVKIAQPSMPSSNVVEHGSLFCSRGCIAGSDGNDAHDSLQDGPQWSVKVPAALDIQSLERGRGVNREGG